MKQLFSVTSLTASYQREAAQIPLIERPVIESVSLNLEANTCRALVGETASGKTTLMLAALQLLPHFGGVSHSGVVEFADTRLTDCTPRALRGLWGNIIGFCPQDAEVTFDPHRSTLEFVAEPLRSHTKLSAKERAERVRGLLTELGGSDIVDRLQGSSASLSTSMRQLLGLVAAMLNNPRLLVLDDPTSSLDALSRSLVVDVLRQRLRDGSVSVWLATHDLALVQDLASHVDVLYAGQIVESATTAAFFEDSLHPYSIGLLASAAGASPDSTGTARLPVVSSTASAEPTTGCRFRERCAFHLHAPAASKLRCQNEEPTLREVLPGHFSRCHFAETVLA
jgi:oligopeptide/dipeptide ABC transporter ATP-binding protein